MLDRSTFGIFDPRLLGIHLNWNTPSSIKRHLKSPLKKHLAEVQAALPTMSPDDRMALLYHFTTTTHEIKHFHDIVGTPFGYSYYFNRLFREQHFCRLLRSAEKLTVPLSKWVARDDCPDDVRDFCHMYSSHCVSEAAMFHGSSFPALHEQVPGLVITAVPPDLHPGVSGDLPAPKIPVVNFGYAVCKRNGIRHHYYPLTALAIMEGAAMNVQGLQIYDLFGAEAAHEFFQTFHQEQFKSDLWIYSITNNLVEQLAARFGCKASESLRFHLYNFAFTGRCRDAQVTTMDMPGWRFGAFVRYALYTHPKVQMTVENLLGVLDEFRERELKEPPLGEILSEHYSTVNDICVLAGTDSGYTGIQEILETVPQHAMVRLSQLYRVMNTLTRTKKDFFSGPWEYACNLQHLPFPPNMSYEEGDLLYSTGGMLGPVEIRSAADIVSLPDQTFWCLYFAVSSFLDQILWTGVPHCAFRNWGVRCPAARGDSNSPSRRSPSDASCICRSAASVLGLLDIDISECS